MSHRTVIEASPLVVAACLIAVRRQLAIEQVDLLVLICSLAFLGWAALLWSTPERHFKSPRIAIWVGMVMAVLASGSTLTRPPSKAILICSALTLLVVSERVYARLDPALRLTAERAAKRDAKRNTLIWLAVVVSLVLLWGSTK